MKVKICGMTRQRDLDRADGLGADFCGFIFHPKSPRRIEPEIAARLRSGRMSRVGVFVNQGANEIRAIMTAARLDYAQLHGSQTAQDAKIIGPERVIRVIWPQREAHAGSPLQAWREFPCAFFLLDAGQSGGGSGAVLDWASLNDLKLGRPWLLAGGLCATNISEAVAACAPWGVDLNSGIEDSPGLKNHEKMTAAIQAARG